MIVKMWFSTEDQRMLLTSAIITLRASQVTTSWYKIFLRRQTTSYFLNCIALASQALSQNNKKSNWSSLAIHLLARLAWSKTISTTSSALPALNSRILIDSLPWNLSMAKKSNYICLTRQMIRIWLRKEKLSMKRWTASSFAFLPRTATLGTKSKNGRTRSKKSVNLRPSFSSRRRATWTHIVRSQSLTRSSNRRQTNWTSREHTRLARTQSRTRTSTQPLPKLSPSPTTTSMKSNFEYCPTERSSRSSSR